MEKLKILLPSTLGDIEAVDIPVLLNNDYYLKAFDDRTIKFLNYISKQIQLNIEINRLPEMAALGFWLRKTNVEKLKSENQHLIDSKNYFIAPLGKVLHICPANVDTMFVYSLAVSLLVGNKNVLRISNRIEAQQVFILFDILNKCIQEKEFEIFTDYINLISYNHNDEVSNFISENVNARVLWGGDNTINTFKKFRTKPRVKDIVFADRVSLMIIDCKRFVTVSENELNVFMQHFFNDAYTFDQMGCSSPQTIYFVGYIDEYDKSIQKLLKKGEKYLLTKYKTDIASLASLKMNRMVDDAINSVVLSKVGNNLITFLQLRDHVDEAQLHGCGGGYFYTKNINVISKLTKINNPKVQTITHWGLDKNQLSTVKALAHGEGIDRIVPLGQALIFNHIWDGYNLFDELSRKVYYDE